MQAPGDVMERDKLLPLLSEMSGVGRERPAGVAGALRRLVRQLDAADDSNSRRQFLVPQKAGKRSRTKWSDLELVHTRFQCDPRIYSHRAFREVPTGKSNRQDFVLGLLREGQLKNVKGSLAEASGIAKDIKKNYLFGEDWAFDGFIALACDHLIADHGVANGPGAPDFVLRSQREITKQHAAQLHNQVGKAMAMCSEAFTTRTQAYVEALQGEPNSVILADALRKADLARDTVLGLKTYGGKLVHFTSLYLRTRTLVDGRSSMAGIRHDFATMINLAEDLDHPRIWIDVLRAMSSYFLLFGKRDEALECLMYLTDSLDHLDLASIFAQTSAVERLIGWAHLAGKNLDHLVKLLVDLLCEHHILYFKQRFELTFGTPLQAFDQRIKNPAIVWQFASRCANFEFFFDRLLN